MAAVLKTAWVNSPREFESHHLRHYIYLMKIGIVTNSYPPNKNGVSVAVYNLEQALIKKGIEVYIATPEIPGTKYKENILPLKSNPAPKHTTHDLRLPKNILTSCYKFFKDKNVDILHSQDTMVGGLETVLIAMQLNIPCVHTYHTLLEEYDYFKFPGYKQFIRSFSQIVCDSHQGVITLSPKIRDYLNGIKVNCQLFLLPNVITNIDSTALNSNFTNLINKYQLSKTFNIINFGRIASEKNIYKSIEVLKPLLTNNPNLRFIILGDGPEKNNLINYINNERLSTKVIFLGEYERNDLQLICRISQFFLMTSYTEVLPTTPLEAMLNGLPVVAVNDRAYEYIVKNTENGFLTDLDSLTEICSELINQPKLLKKLSTEATKTSNEWVNQDFAQEYINMYSGIINNFTGHPLIKNIVIRNLLHAPNFFNRFPNAHL
jgi:1,2-diacylglycerol 3-alpha-glucosyltransferase